VHAGPALVGNFGGGRLFDYTAYGDTVNAAARLQSANKRFGTRICASVGVVDSVSNFKGRPIGDLLLRGRSEPLRAYEPLSAGSFDESMVTQYADAFAKLEAGEAVALPAFAALVGSHANDKLAGFHLKRLLNGEKGVRITVD
jgi:adenylate cyclase